MDGDVGDAARVMARWKKEGMKFLVAALLLLALPLYGDDTLVEYGEGSRSEGLLWLDSPPKVKIWRNGRIVFVRHGVWTAVLPPDRVARLEKDLARVALLKHGIRYVDVEPTRPIGLHGGMSYVRFLHGDQEIVIGTAGRPYRGGPWMRLIDRIRQEIPAEAVEWIPREVTFSCWSWTSGREGWVVTQWPFGDRIQLAGGPYSHTSREFKTSDPAVIAFLLSHSFRDESWRRIVEADGALYRIHVMRVPEWLDPTGTTSAILNWLHDVRFPR